MIASIREQRPTTTAVLEPRGATAGFPEATAERDGAPVAVIVCHGMGQQVPFETLECVAQSLRMATNDPEREVMTQIVRMKQMPTTYGKPPDPVDLRRAEIDLPGPGGAHRVHLYEAYWAPITEGQVGLKEVFWFLLVAGVQGVLRWAQRPVFERWMFGRWVPFKVPARTPFKLFAIVVLLSSLAIINAVLLAVVGARLAGAATFWPGQELFRAFTSAIAIAAIGLLLVAVGIKVVPTGLGFLGRSGARWIAWTAILLGLAAIAVAGAFIVRDIVVSQMEFVPGSGWLGGFVSRLTGIPYVIFIGLVWGLPLIAAAIARRFLVEYVGDVVAYVSSHSVSRFNEIRKAIQKVSLDVASAVYRAAAEDGTPFYGRVVMVGHSLGSVVAYDTLNALLTQDRLDGDAARIRERTAMLITFGSPLNKTAYIFRNQRSPGSEVRETMAAAVQPLISSYDNRTMPWVNLFSKNDWIGGPLEFYDTRKSKDAPAKRDLQEHVRRVLNLEDEDARTPLAAHNEHWKGRKLGQTLVGAIRGGVGVPMFREAVTQKFPLEDI